MKKVMILEDEVSIRSFVVINLKRAGYDVVEAGTGEEALELLKSNPDVGVAILDIMLPGIDGFEVCRSIRATDKKIGIIMLTARSQEMDKITGLMTGADDYMTKPFNILEVKARIKAVKRRNRHIVSADPTTRIIAGNMVMDRNNRHVYIKGREISLTTKEYDVLELLVTNPNKVYGREMLLSLIWGYDYPGDARTVDVHIRRLREKIETNPSEPEYVHTKWGMGYFFKQ